MKSNLTTRNGTPISSFCFGAMQFGGAADNAASQAMFEACRETNINFFDTAYGYCEGRSETWLGAFAKSERENLFIATKCASTGGAGRANILQQFDESQRRLNMDYVDILYIHMWDDETALEETFETLASLIESGKTRHIAVSNFAAWQVMKAQSVAKSIGIRIDMVQPMYNLVKRQAEVEILPMAMAENIAVCPYSPLGGGLLTGKYASGDTGRIDSNTMYASRYSARWMHESAAKLAKMAKDLSVHPATLAVSWVARNSRVTAPIISARNVEQLQPSLDAISYVMEDALYAQISDLSPTPAPATDRSEVT